MKQSIYLVFASFITICFVACKQKINYENRLNSKRKEVADLIQFLNTKPDSAGLRLIVANKLDSVGEYKNALLQIDTLIKNDSAKYGLWMAKANIFLDSGDTTKAKNILQKAISLYPGNEAVASLSEIYANEKNDSCLIMAKQLNEEDSAQSNYISALYFYKMNDANKVGSLLHKSMLQEHEFIKPYLLKGKIFLQNNQTKNALNIFNQGLKIEPKNIDLLNGIANTYLRINQTDSAKVYFSKSLDVRAFQPIVYEQLKSLK